MLLRLQIMRAVCVVLILLLLGATLALAVRTVDVEAAAGVDGVWRPIDCDDVKDGVVLTNISDGHTVVIKNCNITVDAGSEGESAVTIAGLGAKATVEILGCNITSTYGGSQYVTKYGAVQVSGTLGYESKLLLHGTTVSIAVPGNVHHVAAILFTGLVADGFQFRVSHSVLAATCTGSGQTCGGVALSNPPPSYAQPTFRYRTQIAFDESAVSVRSSEIPRSFGVAPPSNVGHCIFTMTRCNVSVFSAMSTGDAAAVADGVLISAHFRREGTVAITECNVDVAATQKARGVSEMALRTATWNVVTSSRTVSISNCSISARSTTDSAEGLRFHDDIAGHGNVVFITGNKVTVRATHEAKGVYFSGGNALSITECHVDAEAMSHRATGVSFEKVQDASLSDCSIFAAAPTHAHAIWNGPGAGVSIARSTVSAAATIDHASGILYHYEYCPERTIHISVETSRISSVAPSNSTALLLAAGSISTQHRGVVSYTRIDVSSSTLSFNGSARSARSGAIASTTRDKLHTTQLSVTSSSFVATGRAAAGSSFVRWPKTITGVSPQSFDNVTFSGDGVAPFALHEGEPGDTAPGPNTTLCLHEVKWTNGTAITAGPAELHGSDACVPTVRTWAMWGTELAWSIGLAMSELMMSQGTRTFGDLTEAVQGWLAVLVAFAVIVYLPFRSATNDTATPRPEVARTWDVDSPADDPHHTPATRRTREVASQVDDVTKDGIIARLQDDVAILSHPAVAAFAEYCRLNQNPDQCKSEDGLAALQAARDAVAETSRIVTGLNRKWCGDTGVEMARTDIGGEQAAAVLLRTRERQHTLAVAAFDADPNDETRGRAAEAEVELQHARTAHQEAAQQAIEARSLFPGLTAHAGVDDATEAVRAAAAGKEAQLERLIKRNPEVVSWPDKSGVLPLHAAACAGHEACVRLLLDYGANPFRVPNIGALDPAVLSLLAQAMAGVAPHNRFEQGSIAPSSVVPPSTNVPADHYGSPDPHYFTGVVAAESRTRHDPITRGLHSLYDTTNTESPPPSNWQPAVPSNRTDTENADVVLVSLSTE